MTDQERKVYGGEMDGPESPPEAEYVLMFLGVESMGLGKSFEGKEPQEQMVLNFKIDADNPQPGSLQEEWHHLDIRDFFTPILHYKPNLPGYTGQKYTEPKLYKLTRALNGGTPLPLETAISDRTGEPYYVGYTMQDVADTIRPFIGRRFRCTIGPSNSGWPRLKGEPLPLLQPGATRRRGAAAGALASSEAPAQQAAQVAAALPAEEDEENPFEQAEMTA